MPFRNNPFTNQDSANISKGRSSGTDQYRDYFRRKPPPERSAFENYLFEPNDECTDAQARFPSLAVFEASTDINDQSATNSSDLDTSSEQDFESRFPTIAELDRSVLSSSLLAFYGSNATAYVTVQQLGARRETKEILADSLPQAQTAVFEQCRPPADPAASMCDIAETSCDSAEAFTSRSSFAQKELRDIEGSSSDSSLVWHLLPLDRSSYLSSVWSAACGLGQSYYNAGRSRISQATTSCKSALAAASAVLWNTYLSIASHVQLSLRTVSGLSESVRHGGERIIPEDNESDYQFGGDPSHHEGGETINTAESGLAVGKSRLIQTADLVRERQADEINGF